MKNPLMTVNNAAYTFHATETTVTRGESRNKVRRTTAAVRFFYVRMPSRAFFYGRALAGESSGSPVASFAGLSTLPCARPPRLRADGGPSTQKGGRIMRHAHARPEQTQSPIGIIRAALREAATAPTVFDALDVTGEALRRLADLVQSEVRHG